MLCVPNMLHTEHPSSPLKVTCRSIKGKPTLINPMPMLETMLFNGPRSMNWLGQIYSLTFTQCRYSISVHVQCMSVDRKQTTAVKKYHIRCEVIYRQCQYYRVLTSWFLHCKMSHLVCVFITKTDLMNHHHDYYYWPIHCFNSCIIIIGNVLI